jgi:hypothetical protein
MVLTLKITLVLHIRQEQAVLIFRFWEYIIVPQMNLVFFESGYIKSKWFTIRSQDEMEVIYTLAS